MNGPEDKMTNLWPERGGQKRRTSQGGRSAGRACGCLALLRRLLLRVVPLCKTGNPTAMVSKPGSNRFPLIWVLMATSSVETGAQRFEVEGHIYYEVRNLARPDSDPIRSERTFRVSVADSQWHIRTESYPPDGRYFEAAFDGRYLYEYRFMSRDPLPSIGFNGSGSVQENDMPCAGENHAVAVWLAYASFNSLAQIRDGRLQPVWLLDDPVLRLTRFRVSAGWQLSAQRPGVPEEIQYFDDGIFRWRDRGGASRSRVREEPYSKGFLRAAFRTLSFTNFEGLTLPQESILDGFHPDPNGKRAEDVVRSSSTRIVAQTFRGAVSVVDFRPTLSGITQIDDRRFWSSNIPIERIRYVITNGVWLSLDDKNLQNFHMQEKARFALQSPAPVPSRWPIYALFIAGLLLFGGLLIKCSRKRKLR